MKKLIGLIVVVAFFWFCYWSFTIVDQSRADKFKSEATSLRAELEASKKQNDELKMSLATRPASSQAVEKK